MSDPNINSQDDFIFNTTPPAAPQIKTTTVVGGWNVNKAITQLTFKGLSKNRVQVYPAFLFDPLTSNAFVAPSNFVAALNGVNWGLFGAALATASIQAVYNPTSPINASYPFEAQRTMSNVQHLEATLSTGSVTIWTPAAGKKYRILALYITVGQGAVAASAIEILVNDSGGGNICRIELFAAASTLSAPFFQYVSLPRNGYLSPTANNTLTVQILSGNTLTTGVVGCQVFGCEE